MRVPSILLHVMRSLSEYPPEVNIARSTVLPVGCADGIHQCAIACTAWALLHMLKMVLREQRDAVIQRNVGS